jgi:hypothetical protein
MNNSGQDLAMLVMGLSATFFVLAMLSKGAVVLPRFFPMPKMPTLREREVARRSAIIQPIPDTSAEETAVAITLALAHLYARELCQNNLGDSLATGPGPWWTAGQLEQHTQEVVITQGSLIQHG